MGMYIARSATLKNSIIIGDNEFAEFERKITEKSLNNAIIPQIVYNCKPGLKFSKEELIRILEEENIIRLHEITHNIYDRNMSKFYEIDEYCITQALKIRNYNPDEDDSLKAYRLATMEFINDPKIREKIVWMKYDKARLGNFTIGQELDLDGITLYDVDGLKYSINELLSTELPNLIVSGSVS
jgi:hypothetical protein